MNDLPRRPELPEPNLSALGAMTRNLLMMHVHRQSHKVPESSMSIQRTNSYNLNYHLKKQQQHETKTISTMALTFDSVSWPRSSGITDYPSINHHRDNSDFYRSNLKASGTSLTRRSSGHSLQSPPWPSRSAISSPSSFPRWRKSSRGS